MTLKALRDRISHGRPERLRAEFVHEEIAVVPYPAFNLRSMFTPMEKVRASVMDVEQFIEETHVAAKGRAGDAFDGCPALRGALSHSLRDSVR